MIGPGVVLNQLVVSSGTWPLLVPLFGPRTRGRPLTQRGALEHDLDGFCAVVAETVNAIYRRDGLPLTDVALTIRPTNLNADTALDGLRPPGALGGRPDGAPAPRPLLGYPRALPRATVRRARGGLVLRRGGRAGGGQAGAAGHLPGHQGSRRRTAGGGARPPRAS